MRARLCTNGFEITFPMKITRTGHCFQWPFYYKRPESKYKVYEVGLRLAQMIEQFPDSINWGELYSIYADNNSGMHFVRIFPSEHQNVIRFFEFPAVSDSGELGMHLGCAMTSIAAEKFKEKIRRLSVGKQSSLVYFHGGEPGLFTSSLEVEFIRVDNEKEWPSELECDLTCSDISDTGIRSYIQYSMSDYDKNCDLLASYIEEETFKRNC